MRVAFTTPNLLTLFRILTAPVLVYLLTFTGPVPSALAAGVFFLATMSDCLDGYIARQYGSGTTLGKFLDPLADKIVVCAVLIMLAGIARTPRVPAWMVVVMVGRELFVTGLRAVAAVEGEVMGADDLGKYKMALQAIAIHGLLIHYTYFYIDFFRGGLFVLWIAMVLAVWSAGAYYTRVRALLRPPAVDAVAKRAAV